MDLGLFQLDSQLIKERAKEVIEKTNSSIPYISYN